MITCVIAGKKPKIPLAVSEINIPETLASPK